MEDEKRWKIVQKSGIILISIYVSFEKEVIENTDLWIPGGQGDYKVGKSGI